MSEMIAGRKGGQFALSYDEEKDKPQLDRSRWKELPPEERNGVVCRVFRLPTGQTKWDGREAVARDLSHPEA